MGGPLLFIISMAMLIADTFKTYSYVFGLFPAFQLSFGLFVVGTVASQRKDAVESCSDPDECYNPSFSDILDMMDYGHVVLSAIVSTVFWFIVVVAFDAGLYRSVYFCDVLFPLSTPFFCIFVFFFF